MADLLKHYAIDKNKAEEGVWETLPSGLEVLVARPGNAAYLSKLAAEMAARKPAIDAAKKRGDEAEGKRLENEAYAAALSGTVLRDWRHLEIGDREIPYTDEAAETILGHPTFEPLLIEILRLARREERYRPEDLDALGKELGNILPGISTTEGS